MRLAMLPHALLALVLPVALVQAQFTYPPPLDRPLTDYTSGLAQSPLNFSAGDNMFGGWTTPGRLKSFLLYRCTHTPSSTPIRPSNRTFIDTQGRVSKAPGDGTWEQMPLFDGGSGFEPGFNPGRNPIWFHGDFFAPQRDDGPPLLVRALPGHVGVRQPARGLQPDRGRPCEWRLRPRRHRRRRVGVVLRHRALRGPAAPASGLTVTWKGGTPRPDIFSNSTESAAAFAREFPQYAKSSSSSFSKESAAAEDTRPSGAATLLGIMVLSLVAVIS
ncbi:hypothetical protein PG994_006595 [Apiospora phragmitis]|uniref:Uncharacterized protein n=1 Tax=Apiospora phragmitis TaxID=2905665 RepID=A0ABR1VJ39_9PEZI